MANKCIKCQRKCKVDENNICTDCLVIPAQTDSEINRSTPYDDKPLSEITVAKFRELMREEMLSMITATVAKEVEPIKADIADLKSKYNTISNNLTDAVKKLELKIDNLEKPVTANTETCKANKVVSDNNFKYLTNIDRNNRRKNVVIFGVPENDDLKINDEDASSDGDKCKVILKYLNYEGEFIDSFRLGLLNEDGRPRPLKVSFAHKDFAAAVLAESSLLKDLTDLNIYINSDRTKSEQAEFKRLGTKKKDLLKKYPTTDPINPRVTLKKGSLQVDGAEVDKFEPAQTLF